jgi:curli biogenesis system outer membrane secretion channel CsgG
MKRIGIGMMLLLLLLTLASGASADEKVRLGVMRFTNNTSAGWWSSSVGNELQDMLIAELAAMDGFSVLERKELDAVMSEQDLGASGRVAKGTQAKIGKITGAKYLVAGTVSAFEEGTSNTGGGLSFGGISVGGNKGTAYMAVDLKVIDSETGEIADVRTVEANSKSTGISLGVSKGGFGGSLDREKKTPTGKAIRACIMEIAEYLQCSLVSGKNAPCMEEYRAKESKRREKTKGAVDLDE